MSEELRSTSPADPRDEIGRFPIANNEAVGRAVERARQAFPAWRDRGFEARAALLRRFRDITAAARDPLASLIAREVGKALWDARGEANLIPAKVDVSLDQGMRPVETLEAAAGIRATYHPRGVLAVLGPFNFPAHLPNGHIVPALATGNTVVFKPSELAPGVGDWLVQAYQKAGIPPGVLQVVQGARDTGEALARHPDVDGVLFTGSYNAGRAIEEAALDQPGKLIALEMGGRNAILVLRDADIELAVAESALSICASTGQRCSCASRLFVHEDVIDEFSERLCSVLRGVVIGEPLDEGTFMGPLVSISARDKVDHYRALADELVEEAGGERLLCIEPDRPSPYVGPGLVRFSRCEQSHPVQRDEIFGPEAALYSVATLEQGIAAINDSDYGLVASVFTKQRAQYEYCIGRVETGLLNWNKGTIGASGKLPFGGSKKSGNHRPAGVSASLYCTSAQAHLENQAAFDPSSLPPGMPRP